MKVAKLNSIWIGLILLLPLSLFFHIPLQYVTSPSLLFWFQALLFIIFIVSIILNLYSVKSLIINSIAILIAVLILQLDLSQTLFLGKKIGEVYEADAPAWSKIEFFSKGKCGYSYGGILGKDYIKYYPYTMKKDSIIITSPSNNFNEFGVVKFKNGAKYEICSIK